jgi:hypothetical protein
LFKQVCGELAFVELHRLSSFHIAFRF